MEPITVAWAVVISMWIHPGMNDPQWMHNLPGPIWGKVGFGGLPDQAACYRVSRLFSEAIENNDVVELRSISCEAYPDVKRG